MAGLTLGSVFLLFFLKIASFQEFNPYQYDQSTLLQDRQIIVHLFEWKWTDIAAECENFLQHYGYGAVQVSPPNEHITFTNYNNGQDLPWWVRYQPVSYKLNSRSGNEAQFTDMVNRCNNVGVRIIVDVVLNHMVGIGQKKGVNGVSSSGDSDFDGTAGVEQFPGVPYGPGDTHDAECNHDIQPSDYQDSAYNVKMCRLSALIDLNQNSTYVRGKMQGYLNHLIDLGVAGFRVDAGKHMWPDDLLKLMNGVKNVRSDIFGQGRRPLVFYEVIDQGGEAVHASDYIEIGRYTNFNFGAAVSSAAKKYSNFGGLTKLGPGYGYGNEDDIYVVNFVDNHDNQRSEPPNVVIYKDGTPYKLAVGFMLAWPYGLPRVMSSYYFDTHDQGPPHIGSPYFNTTSPTFDQSTQMCQRSSGWVCEHRWSEIRNLAKFHQTTTGRATTAITSSNNALAFARYGKGFFALNNNNNANFNLNTQTTLPAGVYCDVYSGDLVNNQCTGKQITVGSDGKASISVLPNSIVAIHVGARIGGPPPDPTPAPSSWQKTVILLKRDTEPGQDVFIRGGNVKNGACASGPYMQNSDPCAIQISHTTNVSFIFVEYLSWSQADFYLDFEGAEQYQGVTYKISLFLGTHDGASPLGTPTVYSTNDQQAPQYQPYNSYGPGYWYVEFKMDCSKTYNGWFELKGYEDSNIGWEPDVSQRSCVGSVGGTAPFSTNNHVGKCGYVNVFEWGINSCTINNL